MPVHRNPRFRLLIGEHIVYNRSGKKVAPMADMKRNVKDSVFTYLFKQPEYTRQLYLALHPEDTRRHRAGFQAGDPGKHSCNRDI